MLLATGLLIVGFILLIFSADWLVNGSSALARKLNIPNIIIGLTVVAFGTSAPELIVSLLAALSGESALSLTNVLGSNIINTYVILGISAIIFPLACAKNTFRYEIPLSMFAGIIILLLGSECFGHVNSNFNGISRLNGAILLGIFLCFVAYTIYQGLNSKEPQDEDDSPIIPTWKSVILMLLGLAGLMLGGKFIVDNAILIAQNFGVPTEIIGVTVVALGTSLPELATSAVAAFKKNTDIAIGNVIGSNIFNVFMVLGISATIKPLSPYNNLIIDSLIAAAASALLLFFAVCSKKRSITRWHGIILLLIYVAYVIWLINNI